MDKRQPPSPEVLRKLLRYDPETGSLFWRERSAGAFQSERAAKSWNTRYANKQAFTALNNYGYFVGNVNYVTCLASRVAWAVTYGEWPNNDTDHINGDRTDNRLCNLRQATRSENHCNKGPQRNNTSGHKGVSWNKRAGRWEAAIGKDGHVKFLGRFEVLADAEAAYRAAATTIHGEFARLA